MLLRDGRMVKVSKHVCVGAWLMVMLTGWQAFVVQAGAAFSRETDFSHTATDPSTIRRIAILVSHSEKGSLTRIIDR